MLRTRLGANLRDQQRLPKTCLNECHSFTSMGSVFFPCAHQISRNPRSKVANYLKKILKGVVFAFVSLTFLGAGRAGPMLPTYWGLLEVDQLICRIAIEPFPGTLLWRRGAWEEKPPNLAGVGWQPTIVEHCISCIITFGWGILGSRLATCWGYCGFTRVYWLRMSFSWFPWYVIIHWHHETPKVVCLGGQFHSTYDTREVLLSSCDLRDRNASRQELPSDDSAQELENMVSSAAFWNSCSVFDFVADTCWYYTADIC